MRKKLCVRLFLINVRAIAELREVYGGNVEIAGIKRCKTFVVRLTAARQRWLARIRSVEVKARTLEAGRQKAFVQH
jgi:hypothetical protein